MTTRDHRGPQVWQPLTSSWGGQELSGLSGDPVTDRAPIIHCRFEEEDIEPPFA